MNLSFSRRSLKSLALLLGPGLLIIIFAPLMFRVGAQSTPPTDCPPPSPAAQCATPASQTKKQAWPQGANITVNIDPTYNTEQRNAIVQSFQNWQTAGGSAGNNSGVRFSFTYNSTPPSMTPPAGTYNVQVWNRDSPRDSGYGGDNAVANNGTNAISQEIWINTKTTDPCALAQTAAHEIGHGFGLGDCSDCADGSSVMVEGNDGYNSLNGTYGPTTCDNNTVKSVAQYPATKTVSTSSGGGGTKGSNIQTFDYYECTTYYWVLYNSWDDGRTWQEVDRWEAGCW